MSKIEARIIMELMGRPAAHVKETLQTLLTRLGSEKGVTILNKKNYDPKKINDSNELYSCFAEVELQLESIESMLYVIFAYSPSNLEIISPENLKISNADLNVFFNSLLDRIHTHGAILKRAVGERDILLRQMEYLSQNLGSKVTDLLKKKESVSPKLSPANIQKGNAKKPKSGKKKSKK
ncbi:hypothetical protein CO038_02565 [Candidatus Pacearchaeota archaeon CG_4_9_14_0_2_um_filter_39_13]|nr:hypothetical protein [Candidatus Pacearchaeota archaeon]OIO44129.1 MAG: hypothetical protein AUJ64_00730 [Candidatus Pacearchaeota archaeon CG1_02_39_14]PJC44667.1 MAG: hypothetical protein CO038_02565 [Candidatus Pacearchaeota archaeon CG_4_9_14_0_2_um_filter_39_13]